MTERRPQMLPPEELLPAALSHMAYLSVNRMVFEVPSVNVAGMRACPSGLTILKVGLPAEMPNTWALAPYEVAAMRRPSAPNGALVVVPAGPTLGSDGQRKVLTTWVPA